MEQITSDSVLDSFLFDEDQEDTETMFGLLFDETIDVEPLPLLALERSPTIVSSASPSSPGTDTSCPLTSETYVPLAPKAAKRSCTEEKSTDVAEAKRRKKELRLLKNRESANKSRQRKKGQIEAMAQQLEKLTEENTELKTQTAALKAESEQLKQQNMFLQNLLLQSKGETPWLTLGRVMDRGELSLTKEMPPLSDQSSAMLSTIAMAVSFSNPSKAAISVLALVAVLIGLILLPRYTFKFHTEKQPKRAVVKKEKQHHCKCQAFRRIRRLVCNVFK